MSPSLQAIALSGGAAVSVGFARLGYALILPSMRTDLSLSYTAAGSLNTANAIGYLAGALMVAILVGSQGNRRLFVFGLWSTAASLLACGLTRDFDLLLFARFISGLGAAGTFICGGVLAGTLGTRMIALFFGGGGWGMVASGLLLPWILEAGGAPAWPMAWLVLGGLCLPLSLAASLAARTISEPGAGMGTQSWPWRQCLPEITAYGMFGLGYIAYMTFMIAWLTQQAAGAFSLPATSSLMWCTLGVATLIAPRLWRRAIGERRDGKPMAWSMATLGLGAVAPLLGFDAGGAGAIAALLVSAFLVGASVFIVPTSATTFVKQNLPAASWGIAMAVVTVVFAIGQALGPLLAGMVSDQTGSLSMGLAVSAAVLAIGAAIAWRQQALA